MHIALWILQVLLGLLFVWAGGFKLVVPIRNDDEPDAEPHARMVSCGLSAWPNCWVDSR